MWRRFIQERRALASRYNSGHIPLLEHPRQSHECSRILARPYSGKCGQRRRNVKSRWRQWTGDRKGQFNPKQLHDAMSSMLRARRRPMIFRPMVFLRLNCQSFASRLWCHKHVAIC